MKRKDQISDTARELFNKYGTAGINTNNIAKECGISPGNLYYYYKNKEEIIRKIFQEISSFMNGEWTGEVKNYVIFFTDMLEKMIHLQDKYLFFFREMFSLFMQDPELKVMYRELMKKRKQEIFLSVRQAMEKGLLKELNDDEINEYIDLTWLNIDFFVLLNELNDEREYKKRVEKLKKNMYNITYIYLTEKGKMLLQELIF